VNRKEAIFLYLAPATNHKKEVATSLFKELALELTIELSEAFKKTTVLQQLQFAKRIGINPAIRQQYGTKLSLSVSKKRAQAIQKGRRDLGEELLSISL